MEELMKNGSAVAAVTALAFVIVGLLQWAVGMTKTSDKKRNELLDQLENCRLESARLKGQLIIYSDKFEDLKTQVRDYKARYRHYKKLYEETQLDPETTPPTPSPDAEIPPQTPSV